MSSSVSNPARALVPMAFVKSVAASIAFYGRLGFTVENTFTPSGQEELAWAWLQSGRAQIMLAKATDPVVASEQAVLFYLYCDDVPAAWERLIAEGVEAGPIQHPFYAPKGEFRIQDPDGYVIMVSHT